MGDDGEVLCSLFHSVQSDGHRDTKTGCFPGIYPVDSRTLWGDVSCPISDQPALDFEAKARLYDATTGGAFAVCVQL